MFGNMTWRRSRKSPWTAGCCCRRQGPPALFPYLRVILTCHQPPFPPLYCPSPHTQLQYFYNCPTNLLSLTLRSFPEGLSGRTVVVKLISLFKTALNHCPGPVECSGHICNKLSCPFSTPSPWSGNNCLSLTQPRTLLKQSHYLIWKYKLDHSSKEKQS